MPLTGIAPWGQRPLRSFSPSNGVAYWQSIAVDLLVLIDALYMLCQWFEQLLDLDLDQLRRRAGKKRRGHDERNLS
jgi:hypothetical protein